MITVKEAYNKAQAVFPKYTLVECLDIGNAFAFYFSPSKEPIPGIPYITVNKESGQVENLTIPPIKNLYLIQNGKHIDIKQLTPSK